ncbi:MAG: RDD family protein, partial [Acidobacteriota bacterium]
PPPDMAPSQVTPPPDMAPSQVMPPPDMAPSQVTPPADMAPSQVMPPADLADAPGAFDVPSFDATPSFDAPAGESPTFDAPAFDAPPFDAPAFDAPAFDAPAFDAPAFDATPAFEAPAAAEPVFEEPAAPAVEPPTFDVPAVEPQAFEVPTYEAPAPVAPAFDAAPAPAPAVQAQPPAPVAFDAPPAFDTPANAPGDEPPVQSWSTPETFAPESLDVPAPAPAPMPAFEIPTEGDPQRSTSADLLPSLDDITASVGPLEMRPPEPISGLATGAVPVAEDDEAELAGFGLRALAYLLDAVLFGGLAFAAFLVTENQLIAGGVNLLGALIIVVCWAVAGTSPGKRALGLMIVDSEGENRLGFGKAAIRAVGYLVSAIPLGAGFLMAAVTKDKRALHDKIAGTWVYRT